MQKKREREKLTNATMIVLQPRLSHHIFICSQITVLSDVKSFQHLSPNGHKEDKEWLESNPTALSSKCARVVTRPDVERALVKWFKHMEEKGEHVTGAMLMAKREKFENAFQVPEVERLKTRGWVTNFCKA